MDSSKLRFRFEQRRGHYLVAEGLDEHPMTRKDCDNFQLRMLTTCDIPGLLKLEIEELDGCLALRYALNGVKMLSQAMRTRQWTMAAYMNAVCRLGEVLEDCRLYVLNADCILLEDDRIFIGEAGEFDLRFVYLPFPLEARNFTTSLEMLMIRWMMYVSDPDGKVIQQMLRLISSPTFKPSDLSRFARQYRAQEAENSPSNAAIAKTDDAPISWNHPNVEAVVATEDASSLASTPNASSPNASRWRWFQPSPADAHSMSALLGDEPEAAGGVPQSPPAPSSIDRGRERVWLLCAAAGLTAIAWRLGYASMPNSSGLAISLGATIVVAVATIWLLLRRTRDRVRPSSADAEAGAGDNHKQVHSGDQLPEIKQFGTAGHQPNRQVERVAAEVSQHDERRFSPAAEVSQHDERRSWPAADVSQHDERQFQPSVVSTPDEKEQEVVFNGQETERTQYLEPGSRQQDTAVYYLVWESEPHAAAIPLLGPSLVIGRSREASGHLDVTPGISRAHIELLNTDKGWTATDLGSRNGTKLNGTEMTAYESYVLQPEDSLDLAGSVYRFKFGKLQQRAS